LASTSSFDVTTGVDYMEVRNAVDQTVKEITQRYDFKGLKVSVELNEKEKTITLAAPDEYKLKAVWDVLQSKMVRRQVPQSQRQSQSDVSDRLPARDSTTSRPKQPPCCNKDNPLNFGNPINIAFGEKYQRETDYVAAGATPLKFERHYSHSAWRHTYQRAIEQTTILDTTAHKKIAIWARRERRSKLS